MNGRYLAVRLIVRQLSAEITRHKRRQPPASYHNMLLYRIKQPSYDTIKSNYLQAFF